MIGQDVSTSFVQGKVTKGKYIQGIFIFLKYHTVPRRPKWPLYHATKSISKLHKSVIESSALKQCFQQREHKEKTLSGSEVIGLHFGYPDDRMVRLMLVFKLNYN